MESESFSVLQDGSATFFDAPRISVEQLRPGQVAIAGAPHDTTHTTRFGTRYGPRGVREASSVLLRQFNRRDGVLDLATGARLRFKGPGVFADVGDLDVYPADVAATTEGIRHGAAAIARQGAFPVIVGGDHYTSYPAYLGYSDAMQEGGKVSRVGYIHIDGHLDFNDTSPIWGRYNHGTNARRISESNLISGRNMVWIGIQGWVGSEEVDAIRRIGGTVFTHEDVRTLGILTVVRKAAEVAIRGCDSIYLSLDIDVLDAGYSPGTGGVVIGGMTPMELMQAMNVLAEFPIGAMDLTEVSPNLDRTGRTVSYAANALVHLAGPAVFERLERATGKGLS